MLQELIMTTDASKIDDMYEPEKAFKPLKRSLSSMSNGSAKSIPEETLRNLI